MVVVVWCSGLSYQAREMDHRVSALQHISVVTRLDPEGDKAFEPLEQLAPLVQARLPDVVAGRLCAGAHGSKSLGRGETRRGSYRMWRLREGSDMKSRALVVEGGSRCEADLADECRRNAKQSESFFPGRIQVPCVTMMACVQCFV